MKSIATTSPIRICHTKLAASLAFALAFAGTAGAATITFSELPNQPVNGLTFLDVTFGFSVGNVASTDAVFNSAAIGGSTTLNLQSPTLEGNATGLLTLDFAQPVSHFSFDLARLTAVTATGATVSLFDSSLSGFATSSVTVSNFATFSEGTFDYTGGTPVRRAVVSFAPGAGPRFAIDNLTYNAVPEPGTILTGLFLAGFCGIARTRRS